MLILFVFFLIVAVGLILLIRRNQESLYLLVLCISLAIYLLGVMMYIAKKGGINRDLQSFLFLSNEIKLMFQYFLITLDRLGMIILLGRVLFPAALIEIAVHFSMIRRIRESKYLKKLLLVLPAVTFILYYPSVFRSLAHKFTWYQDVMIRFSYYWILAYMGAAVLLLLYEYKEFKFIFWKRYFMYITLFIASLMIIFSLYVKQDPSQVYFFNSDSYVWTGGIYYMNSAMSVRSYVLVILLNLMAASVGLFSFFKYTRGSIMHDQEDIIMKRKFDTASIGASSFVHSTKNQILSNRVLLKRLQKDIEEDAYEKENFESNVRMLQEINERLLERVDDLYKSVKINSIVMVPTSSGELLEGTLQRFRDKYPEVIVEIKDSELTLMADAFQVSEALYNLLSNAADSILSKFSDVKEGLIEIRCYNERLYSIIEISDNGNGIKANDHLKIFEPFYTSKNSNYNWGMGLYYAREIIKGHSGTIRFETKEGEGTKFFVLLPRY